MANDTDLIANMDLLLAGMFQDQYANAKDLEAKQQAFAKLLYDDLREVYDSFIPNVHILDADKVAREVVIGIIKQPELILSIADKSYVESTRQELLKNSRVLRAAIRDAIKDRHDKSAKNYKGKNPLQDLNSKMSSILAKYTVLDRDSVLSIGKEFNREINAIFGKNSLIGIDAEVAGIQPGPFRFVFFQKAFATSGKDTLNKDVTKALQDRLQKINLSNANVNTSVTSITGKFVDFGHVGAQGPSGIFKINTPALTKIIYNVSNLSTQAIKVGLKNVDLARNIFIKKTGHISQSITVTKEFSESTGILFQLGMTLTTDMPSEFNRTILGSKEKKISDRAVADRLNSTELLRRALVERLQSTFLGKNIKKVLEGKSSPSIKDYIVDSLTAKLLGKKAPKLSQKKTRTKTTTVTYSTVNSKASTKATTKSQPSRLSIDDNYVPQNVVPETNLTNLQMLLNKYLQDVISANMGNGNDRKVLNYRTGRLAASAKVERLTQSREGMVTAFYTYMKNPYATFSEGGRQQYPKSRDPKLLISGAIREIAATQAVTRLRSVLV